LILLVKYDAAWLIYVHDPPITMSALPCGVSIVSNANVPIVSKLIVCIKLLLFEN
jgi:hypothetical protein